MKCILLFIAIIQAFLSFGQEYATKVAAPFTSLYKVSDSIYRSEQPDSLGMGYLQENQFRSVLNLMKKQTGDQFQNHELQLYHVSLRAESIDRDSVIKALKIIRDAPKPLVIHCRHGADRTGLLIALYRIIYQDMDKEAAIAELKDKRFGHHKIFFNIPRFIRKTDINQLIIDSQ